MADAIVTLEHYDYIEDAVRDREILADAGIEATIYDALSRTALNGATPVIHAPVYGLQVGESQAEAALTILEPLWAQEEEGNFEMLEEFEHESDEAREIFEQV